MGIALPGLEVDVSIRNAWFVRLARGRRNIATLVALVCLASACDKSTSPTAPTPPSDTSSGLSIEGVVRQRTDGHGVAGARVEIAEGVNQGAQSAADGQGRYRLNNLAPGTFTLRALAEGYSAGVQSVTLSTNQTLDFTLEQSTTTPPPPAATRFTVSGSVSESRNESPIRGARVRVVAGPDRGTSTETDLSGRYSLSVQAGALTVEVSATGFTSQTRDVTIEGDLVIHFELHSGPSTTPAPSGPVVRGTTVDGVSDGAIAGVRIRIDGGTEVISGGDGTFEFTASTTERALAVTITSQFTVERSTRLRVTPGPATLTLIPKSLNLTAFDQMFRGTGALRRWTSAPPIVVERRVLRFTDVNATSFVATPSLLSDAEVDALLDELQSALPDLTGGTFDRFANRTVETAAEGDSVTVSRPGVIVLAQYEGLTDATSFWGYTRWAWNERGEMRAASMMIDRAFEVSSSPYRRSLRTHELGHALGYHHVDARESVMNSSGRVPLTDFDRHGAKVAFLRAPLNMSPDIDPDPITVNRAPAGGLTWTGDR